MLYNERSTEENEMARFRATIRGARGEASRLGHASTGIKADVNGWESGVSVEAEAVAGNADMFYVYATGGSNGSARDLIAAVSRNVISGKIVVVTFDKYSHTQTREV